MKKVLNISTVQQALRRLPVAFLIAGSGFLPNASAVRYTIDFGGKSIEYEKCEKFFDCVQLEAPRDIRDAYCREALDPKYCKLSLTKKEDDSCDVVFKNGSITKEESQKFPKANLDSLTFDGCKGKLDLSEIFQRSVSKILMEKCDFTIAENCFKYTKNFEPCNSDLFLENGLFHIPDEIKDWIGNAHIILPKVARRANNTTLEAPLSIPFNAAVDALRRCQCSLGYYYGHIKFLKPAEVAPENAEYKEKYEEIKVLSQNLLEKNTQQRKEILNLKEQIEVLKNEHREKVDNMQRARESDMRELKEKREEAAQKLKKVSQELERKNKEIASKDQRIKELEDYLEGSKKVSVYLKEELARKQLETEAQRREIENKQREIDRKDSELNCCLSCGRVPPLLSGDQ